MRLFSAPFKALLYLISVLALTSCGFKGRDVKQIPPYLQIINVESSQPNALLETQLKRLLIARGTRLSSQAPVTLRITQYSWSAPPLTMFYGSGATVYSYTLTIQFILTNRHGVILFGPKGLSITRDLTQNANQIYVPQAESLMKQPMTQSMATLIVEQLFSIEIKKVFTSHPSS